MQFLKCVHVADLLLRKAYTTVTQTSFVNSKMSVVLTPTISLMKDQYSKLEEVRVPATCTGSSQTDVCVNDKIRIKDFNKTIYTKENFLNHESKLTKI